MPADLVAEKAFHYVSTQNPAQTNDRAVELAERAARECRKKAAELGARRHGRSTSAAVAASVEFEGRPVRLEITAQRGSLANLSDQAAAQALADAVTDAYRAAWAPSIPPEDRAR